MRTVLNEIEASNRQAALSMTWGHLAPKRGTHTGSIILGISERDNSNPEILKTDFPTMDASPWEYCALYEIANEMASIHNFDTGRIYKLSGEITWGDIVPENFDLEQWREDRGEEPDAMPEFEQGMVDWEFTYEILFTF